MHWKTGVGRCIYQHPHAEISVHQNLCYRWLIFANGPVQSLINRYQPHKPALEYVKPLIIPALYQPGATCLLGLGGAGVAHALAAATKTYRFMAIEHHPLVIQLAARYFMSARLTHLTIRAQDAAEFVSGTTERYQHLIIDLFNSQQFPAHCNNLAFFTACQTLLTPTGILAINTVSTHDLRRLLGYLHALFAHRIVLIPVAHTTNTIALAYNGSRVEPLLQLVRQAPGIKQLIWDAQWGYIAQLR